MYDLIIINTIPSGILDSGNLTAFLQSTKQLIIITSQLAKAAAQLIIILKIKSPSLSEKSYY